MFNSFSSLLIIFVFIFNACSVEETSFDTTLFDTNTTDTTTSSTTESTDDTSAPTFTSANSFSIEENKVFVATITTDDSNVILNLSGDDATFFDLNNSTLNFKNAPDFEVTPNRYSIVVSATDTNGNKREQVLSITVLNVAEIVPTISSLTASIDENIAIGGVVGDVNVTISGDSAITSFTLNDTTNFDISTSGKITTKTALDFETTNEYNLSVYATNSAGNSSEKSVRIIINDIYEVTPLNVPTLVVIMNWDDYSENDPSIWHDKIFDKSKNSVNRWYDEVTGGALQIVPVDENSSVANDGIIIVNMGKNHPGGSDNTAFRDNEISAAIQKTEVVDSMDFAALDSDGDGNLNKKELQIVFIVSGGEESYGDNQANSIWAHAWSFGSGSTLSVDGVKVMRYDTNASAEGGYARFGANHDTHKATIGIIAHELGHSLLSLGDYYDDGGGSGLGWYDVMSGGSWARQSSDTYSGDTPMGFSAYNRIDSGLDMNVTDVNSSQDVTIECSSRDLIKLVTSKANEYFLIECRDSAKANSEISFEYADGSFTDNKLFMMMYHIDTDKAGNTEHGDQNSSNHYKVSLVEKDITTLMTGSENIRADYGDVYVLGDRIETTKTKLYDDTNTDYSIEVTNEDYSNREMTIRITK